MTKGTSTQTRDKNSKIDILKDRSTKTQICEQLQNEKNRHIFTTERQMKRVKANKAET